MLKHIWSVLCQKTVIDQNTNNISIIDILEEIEINLDSIPKKQIQELEKINIPIQYEIVTLLTKKEVENPKKVEAELKITLIDPKGKKIKKIDKKPTIIPKNKARLRNITKIQSLPISESGVYTFKISLKHKDKKRFRTVAKLPLRVKRNT